MAAMNRFGSVLVLLLLLCVDVFAATINGTVKDTNGNNVEGALVTFTDESNPDQYFYDYTDSGGKYKVIILGPLSIDNNVPAPFRLEQNYPNPFNPSTTIPFSLDTAGHVNLTVYNIMGQAVKTLVDHYTSSGIHTVNWNGTDDNGNGVAAGIYLYRMTHNSNIESKKMLLLDGGGFIQKVNDTHAINQIQKPVLPAESSNYTVSVIKDGYNDYLKEGLDINSSSILDITLIPDTTIIFNDITFITIPGGTFQMGDVEGVGNDSYSNEKPVHTVTVSGFEMSIYEVTNAQYAEYLNSALEFGDIEASSSSVTDNTGYWNGQELIYLAGFYLNFPVNDCKIVYDNLSFSVKFGYENWPVGWVTWYGAKSFAEYYGFDLPTEAEWEYACRGGKQYLYGTADGELIKGISREPNTPGHSVSVGSYPENPFGLYDMSGNVWEWCNDWYGIYSSESVNDPTGTDSDSDRVLRGGSKEVNEGNAEYHRAAYRGHISPDYRDDSLGFRVVSR